MPIHKQLSDLLEISGMSRSELARRLDVGAPQVSNWLNGKVPIPAHRADAIRHVLDGVKEGTSRHQPAHPAVVDTADSALDWRFVFANVYAGKDFGNAGIYATPQSIPSLVRETGQNSLDASSDGSITMRYTLFELSPDSRRYERFMAALRFDDALARHVAGAAESGGTNKIGVRLKSALQHIASRGTLRLLRVEDFSAKGLCGDEHDSTQPFSALVRDNLNSRKAQATAGGIFGIGSKTLWSCSRLSTVLFASTILGEEEKGVRVIGKADLAYHEDEDGNAFAGAGWFGLPIEDDGAESLWVDRESDILEDLLLSRVPPDGEESETGTTALILGFADPKADDDDGEGIVKRFASSLAEYFWPAMVSDQLIAHVEHFVDDDEEPRTSIRIDPDQFVPAFADAFRKHRSGDLTDSLEKPGDVVSVPIKLTIPATRPEGGVYPSHGISEAECRLVIRLADPTTTPSDRWIDHVGYARGRAMVVKYERRTGIATGARAFHAVLLAGTLAGTGAAERHAEQFLRFAEPTSHDDWTLNGDLKERYSHGAGARIREMYEQVVKALQKFVKTESTTSSEGPAVLKELFSLRVVKPVPKRAKWTLRNIVARPSDDGWKVSGEVIVDDATSGYAFTPRVSFDPESGRGLELQWESLESQDATVDGGTLRAEAGTRKVRFEGKAIADEGLDVERCVLRVDAQLVMKGGDS